MSFFNLVFFCVVRSSMIARGFHFRRVFIRAGKSFEGRFFFSNVFSIVVAMPAV